jgi:uncharacterized protein
VAPWRFDIPDLGDPLVLLAAAVAIFLAAAVQGVTGFGHALLAIGVLSVLYDARDAILILTLVAPLIAIAVFVRLRRHVDWGEAAWLTVPLVIGMVPGLWLFSVFDKDVLRRIVGIILVVFTIWYASPISPRPRRLGRGWAIVAGGSAGFLAGLASTGGPPLVLFLLVHDLEKRRSMAVLQAVFVMGSVIKVGMAWGADLFTGEQTVLAAALAVPLVAGVLLGQRLFDRLSARHVKRLSLVLLGVVGIALAAGF